MRIIIQMTKEEYDGYAESAKECGWGDDVSTHIKECAYDNMGDYIYDAQIQVVADMKTMLEDILKGL